MSGPASLRAKKGLLTRYSNALNEIVLSNTTLLAGDPTLQELAKVSTALKVRCSTVLETLTELLNMIDHLEDTLTEEQDTKLQEYIVGIQDVVAKSHTLIADIEARKAGLQEAGVSRENLRGTLQQAKVELPAIPIPKFAGKLEEFDNFWSLFESNVNSQNLTNLQKFNYLLSALKGEARQVIGRYAVTERNYPLAVDLLRSKYGDRSKIIRHLQTRLETASAKGSKIADQRQLLEYLLSFTTQLEQYDVTLRGSFITQKLLSKFEIDLQRKILKVMTSQNISDEDWNAGDLLKELDKLIAAEERVAEMIRDNEPLAKRKGREQQMGNRPEQAQKGKSPFSQKKCIYCQSTDHNSLRCSKVRDISGRIEQMKQKKLCINCGKENHFVQECLSKGCIRCDKKKHHFSICPKLMEEINSDLMSNARDSLHSSQSARSISEKKTRSRNRGNVQCIETRDRDPPANHVELTCSEQVLNSECEAFAESHAGKTNVFLLTVTARIQHPKTQATQEVQILLDTGADNSFIQKHLADELELPTLRTTELLMYTFGSKKPTPCTYGVTSVRLWDNHDQPLDLTLCKTDTISGKGKQVVLDEWDREYLAKEHIDLPNPDGSIIRPKILLGCDQMWNLIKFPCKGHVLPSGLHIIPSRLGYLLTGKSALKEEKASSGTCNFNESDCDISFEAEDETDKWDRYWTIDSAGIEEFTGPTKIERATVAKRVHHDFNATIERRSDGYYVRLPFKDNRDSLPTNYKLAQRRLSSVLQKLREKPELLKQYNAVFVEQLEKGVIEKVTSKEQLGSGHVHYLPHQAVLTPKKETTKLRIVFDAASHYKDCPALNEVLHQGPTLLPDLYAVLLRFRLEPYVATADVEKAFLQIRLHEDDRDVTRFLWVRDLTLPPENDNLVCFRFTRVPFGLNASPFLLGGTIQFHLQKSVSDHALAQQIQHNLYVDNLVLGAETPEELGHKSEAARAIFCDMKLNLREFLSNTEHVTSVIPRDKCAKTESQKVLGILWHSKQDSLQISCNFPNKTFITKRTVTQQIASIYDPLGWLVPIMVLPKQFQQNLWRHDYAWDQKLSQPHQDQWEKILHAINGIDKEIKRYIPICEANQLALFSDASENAMAACAYLVSENSASLLMAKSKLPSIKTRITIPKVEMNALAIAGRLALSILNALLAKVHTIRRVLFFSDSQIVLGWTKKGPHERDLGKLVTNRIKELQNIVTTIRSMGPEVAFGYVPSECNPADAGTRGLSREQFLDHYWWTGPNFLRNPNGDWTQSLFTIESPATANETLAFTVVSENKSQIFPWHRHSSYIQAQRTMAWVLRFLRAFTKHLQPAHQLRVYTTIPLLKSDAQTDEKALTGAEIRQSKMLLIRLHQANFSEDYIKSMDNTLKLFKDSMGLWRVRGRLGSTTLEDSAKFPILISPKSEIADLILRDAHGKFHSGIAHTMSTVRQEYWIPRLRQKTSNLIQHCVRCRRFNAAPYFYPAMPDLPARRVQQSAPFQHIGLDFFDLPKVLDGSSSVKVYGCIFTCAVTRLIHLEVVTNMGTIAFFNALRRFFSRRGIPSSITCDNAPTFILCEELLRAAIQNAESNPLIANNNIDWKHITPYAPWQGGFYERLIQTVKRSLYKALGRALLDLDTLTTVITEVEASLNTRPLTYQEAEPENLKPLRPIDFIQKNMTITYPLDTITVDTSDPDYHPPALAHALQTRKQAEEALQSYYAVTQKTWEIWHTHTS